MLRDKFAAEAKSSEGAQSAAQALDHIKDLVKGLYDAASQGRDEEAEHVLQEVTSLFSRSEDPISSFELLRSGLVEALYSFATSSDGGLPLERRRSLMIKTLMDTDAKTGQSGATVLVRRLQEALSRLENVEITTALSGGSDDVRKSPSAMLGRQLRLRLQADDATDIPRNCNNIIVTIHAVATFRSLSDYLRPKIAVSSLPLAQALVLELLGPLPPRDFPRCWQHLPLLLVQEASLSWRQQRQQQRQERECFKLF